MKLLKYAIDTKYFFEYVESHKVNFLAKTLISSVNFDEGSCFTFLPEDADKKRITSFQFGGMAKGAHENTRELIHQRLNIFKNSCFVFDDINSDYFPGYEGNLFLKYGYFLNKEIYYAICSKNSSEELISRVLFVSDAIWHSLGVLTEANLDEVVDKKFTPEKIEEICKKTTMIIMRAYDGEGYIFWEKKKSLETS